MEWERQGGREERGRGDKVQRYEKGERGRESQTKGRVMEKEGQSEGEREGEERGTKEKKMERERKR